MKTANAVELTFEVSEEYVKPREEVVPPWRQRLRWWLVELFRPARLVRLVGPNERPLERYEFERPEVNYARRVL